MCHRLRRLILASAICSGLGAAEPAGTPVAEWVFRLGGFVVLGRQTNRIQDLDELPSQYLLVNTATLVDVIVGAPSGRIEIGQGRDGTPFDSCCLLYLEEPTDANYKITTRSYTKMAGTFEDVYRRLSNGVLGVRLEAFSIGSKELPELVAG